MVVGREPVIAPLPDVADRVVQTIAVGIECADIDGFTTRCAERYPWLSEALFRVGLSGSSQAVRGGSVEPLANAVGIVEAAMEEGASVVLMPVSARRQLLELSDAMATRINVPFHSDTPDASFKALLE